MKRATFCLAAVLIVATGSGLAGCGNEGTTGASNSATPPTKDSATTTASASASEAATEPSAAPSASASASASTDASASASGATSAPAPGNSGAPAASASAKKSKYNCGGKGQKACPMQGWMKGVMGRAMQGGDKDKIAQALNTIAAKTPPGGYGQWAGIAAAGASKAAAGDIDGAKQSCKKCHALYQKKYKDNQRDQPW